MFNDDTIYNTAPAGVLLDESIYTGGAILGGVEVYNNTRESVEKDKIVSQLVKDNISECAVYLNRAPGEPCIAPETTKKIGAALGITGSPAEIVNSSKQKLSCDSERCLLGQLERVIGRDRAEYEKKVHLKIEGPTDSSLLSNKNIDGVMFQWSIAFPEFYAYNFNMKNYASYSWRNGRVNDSPDTLATISFTDLYAAGKRCAGCIINSDVYQGDGKHWMCLFADARNPSKYTVEFFNSSGNAPAPEWVNWLIKTKNQMEGLSPKPTEVEIIKVTNIRHQQSKSECGLYSLFYIWARLNNIPTDYFMNNIIQDQTMFEFRQHLFDDKTRKSLKKFNWDEYKKTTDIEWE